MTRRGALALCLLLAPLALADEPPLDACFGNRQAGDACATEDGAPGTCVEQTFEYERGGRRFTQTHLICVATVSAKAQRVLPWLGVSLSFLALAFGLAGRRAPPTAASAAG